MFRPRLCPFHLFLFLTFASFSFPSVTPQRLASLGAFNNFSKFVQDFGQNLSPVLETLKTRNKIQNLSHAFLANTIKGDLHSISPSRTPLRVRSRSVLVPVHEQSTQLQVSSRQSGLNFDTCISSSECAGLRFCLTIIEGGSLGVCVGSSDPGCFCRRKKARDIYCTSDSDCDDGESCIEVRSESICFSDNAGSTNRDDESSSSGSSSSGSGLNGENCRTDSDCTLPRQCFDSQSTDGPRFCRSANVCNCFSTNPGDLFCTSDSNCDFGERCTEVNSDFLCLSDAGTITSGDNSSSVAVVSSPSGSGLNGDSCTKNSDCAAPRRCFERDGALKGIIIPCSSGRICLCSPTKPEDLVCNSDSDCEDGENCVTVDSVKVCVSDNNILGITTSTSGTEAICIGSDSLTHLAKEDLIFEHDALAHVLCDANESCATPGHMVVYKGEALMMKSYCELVECTRKVKRVNSPKFVRRMVVPSQTRDLMFTVFAARYGTFVEEGVLSVAVRVGF